MQRLVESHLGRVSSEKKREGRTAFSEKHIDCS
jgi:hypothetical protein